LQVRQAAHFHRSVFSTVHFSAVFAVKSVLTLYAFYRKNGLITSSCSFFLNLIDGGLRTCER
jgi:hypothetical protein